MLNRKMQTLTTFTFNFRVKVDFHRHVFGYERTLTFVNFNHVKK